MDRQVLAEEPLGRTSSAAQSNARILIVDDDERNLLALSHALRDIAEIVTTTSGRGALRELLNGDYAVILLDVYMPGMDGYEVAGLIRQREQTARIPIIFLSAINKETDHLMRGYSMGAVDYVFKPVDPIVLKSKVSVFVDLYQMRTQIEATNRAEQESREARFTAELDRLRLEAELHESRARLANMLDALPLALFEASAEDSGQLVRRFVGGNLARIIGDDAALIEDGSGNWEERIHVDDAATLKVPSSPSPNQKLSREYRWRESDGTIHHFNEQIVLVQATKNRSRWAGTLIDVTDRKQLEAQLLQAGKMDAIGKLTGGVAHDFNNLLAAVLGGLDVLERRISFGPNEQAIVEQMRLAANKGADLIRRMMAFARKQDLTPVSIAPSAICEALAGLLEQTLGGTVTIDWTCPQLGRNFFVDRVQLELALLNIIINARDAMPDGGIIEVAISEADSERLARAKLADGPYLCITIKDPGSGIPTAIIERITEPFFTTKEVGKGTGLGLSMVMSFVQQSGGKLFIESEEGRGTIVELLLPSADHEAVTDQRTPQEEDAPPSVRSILLVDDDEMVRTVLAAQLRDLGLTVVEATGGLEALDIVAVEDGNFDLMLTDYAMPHFNGLRTIEKVRELRPDIRVALMTGYMDEQFDMNGGGVDVLQKPVSTRALTRILR
ncbi:MAG: response regulator [Sphingobium sp.]|nr:response regulator [Sphingobium sp.]